MSQITLISIALGEKDGKTFHTKPKGTHNFNNNQQRHSNWRNHTSFADCFFVGIFFFVVRFVHFSRAKSTQAKFINFIHRIQRQFIRPSFICTHHTHQAATKNTKNYVLRPIDERVRYLYTPYFSGFWRDCTSFWIFYFSHTHTLAHSHSRTHTCERSEHSARSCWLVSEMDVYIAVYPCVLYMHIRLGLYISNKNTGYSGSLDYRSLAAICIHGVFDGIY